tara:strand:- start:1190 stop:1735 length:546 start_codon:yes stop_codon:yes gene_type:complete
MNIINLIFPYDYIILGMTIIVTIFSFWRGFIHSVLGLLTWIGSVLITLYSYDPFANFLNSQLLKINFLENFETFTNIFSLILSIPLIFLVTLFFLKRIRKILSSDLDKQVFGVIIDKSFGFFYGLVFSYFIFSTILYLLNQFNFESLNLWLINNSEILNSINDINYLLIFSNFPIEDVNQI